MNQTVPTQRFFERLREPKVLFEHSRLRSVVVICLHFYSQKSVVKPVSKSKPSANRLPYIFSKYTDDRPIVLTFNIDFSGKEIHSEET